MSGCPSDTDETYEPSAVIYLAPRDDVDDFAVVEVATAVVRERKHENVQRYIDLFGRTRPTATCGTPRTDHTQGLRTPCPAAAVTGRGFVLTVTTVPYTESYESALLRGDQDPLPWVVHDEITTVLSSADRLLDIGCGTAFKTVKLAPLARQVVGVEPNSRMLAKATANIRSAAATNMTAVAGRAEQLPFRNNLFDVVTVMLAPHDVSEVSRVLRPGGCAVLEKLGDQDKANVKAAFGADAQGPRGQFADLTPGERVDLLQRELSAWFSHVDVRVGTWATYYTLDGLLMLLEQTPTVRAFDREADADAIAKLQEDHSHERGIKTIQERILVHAWK